MYPPESVCVRFSAVRAWSYFTFLVKNHCASTHQQHSLVSSFAGNEYALRSWVARVFICWFSLAQISQKNVSFRALVVSLKKPIDTHFWLLWWVMILIWTNCRGVYLILLLSVVINNYETSKSKKLQTKVEIEEQIRFLVCCTKIRSLRAPDNPPLYWS